MLFYDHHVVRGHVIEGYLSASDEVRRKERLPPFRNRHTRGGTRE
jgi:hypothetical protein